MQASGGNLAGAPGPVPGRVVLRLMGRFAVVRDGREVDEGAFGGRKVRTLLRVLAVRQGQFVSNDVLAEALWPQRPPANPAANLQVLVNRARRAVGYPELIRTGPGGYALAGPPDCTVDAEAFLAAVDGAGRLAGATALAGLRRALAEAAEPLPEDAYADWSQPYRARVLQARQSAWERAAALAVDLGEPALAVRYATAAAEAEPLREAAALSLVRALAAAGDPAGALGAYDRYRQRLADELGLDPSPAAAALHRRLLRADPAPPVGAAEPGSRASARAAQPGADAAPGVPAFGELPFVGRDGTLREVVAALPAGVVQVAGRSGTGKSRLLAALAAGRPATVAAAYWADRDEPWSLVRTLVRARLAGDPAAAGALPARLRDGLAYLLPELDQPAGGFDAETRNALIREAARRLLTAAPQRLIAVDDVQWADPSSLHLLGSLAGRPGAVALVVAYRPDELTPDAGALLRRLPGRPVITLGGLLEPALAALVEDAEVGAALAGDTDRTPLAVAEVLRVLHAEGLLAPDGTGRRWRATAPGAAARAREVGRDGQRRAIANRAAAHEGPAATVLHLLALLGRYAAAGTLAAAAEVPEPQALRLLEQLSAADLVRPSHRGWHTAHDMVAEVVVAGLTGAARARLHLRLATVLEAEGEAAEQARHWLGAGDPTRAARAYARAAAQALEQTADAEAEQLATAGLATAGSADATIHADLLLTRAQARRRRGDIAAARDDLRAALRAYPRGPARATVLAHLAALDSGADDLRRAAEVAELALVEAGGDDAARALALEVASIIDMNLNETARAQLRAAEAVAIYGRAGDSRGAARVVDARAMAAFLHGSVEDGVAELDRAAYLFETAGDLMRTITPRSTCGHGRVLLHDAGAGLLDTELALDVARTIGHPEGQTYALWHRSEALSALGRPDEALADGRAALAIAEQLNHRGWTATAWRAIGIAYQTAGDLPAALDAFQRSLDRSANLDLFGCWAAARAALVCVDLGRPEPARELVARALAGGPALGRHEARWAAAALAVAAGDPGAPTIIETAVAAASAAGARAYLPPLADLAHRCAPAG